MAFRTSGVFREENYISEGRTCKTSDMVENSYKWGSTVYTYIYRLKLVEREIETIC